MAIVAITTQAQRDFLEDVLEHLQKLSYLNSEAARAQARADAKVAARDAWGTKVRSTIVREFAAADGVLEAQLSDFAVVRDENGDITAIHTNTDVP